MKTTLHTYSYDLGNGDGVEYATLKAKLENTPGRGHQMHSLRMPGRDEPEAGEIELDHECLFQNQWNSDKGRVFDWYEEAVFDDRGRECKLIKRGHYLDITSAMVKIRQDTLKCGYTGHQFSRFDFPAGSHLLNVRPDALGSPYLKESELHLLRLLPVCDEWTVQRQPLTDEERAYILPLYIAAQTQTNTKARDGQREKVLKDYEQAMHTATQERDGFLWLLDHGVQTENCIYYSHTGRFGFGWRSPYTGKAREAMLAILAKFPFPYDVQ